MCIQVEWSREKLHAGAEEREVASRSSKVQGKGLPKGPGICFPYLYHLSSFLVIDYLKLSVPLTEFILHYFLKFILTVLERVLNTALSPKLRVCGSRYCFLFPQSLTPSEGFAHTTVWKYVISLLFSNMPFSTLSTFFHRWFCDMDGHW